MDFMSEYERWLKRVNDDERRELEEIRGDAGEIKSRFYGRLDFGTAGLRGVMGVGLARMNVYVIRHVTQAFARVICGEGSEKMAKGVVICHDCRRNSRVFAAEAACVMAANGIRVRLFEKMRPTPELSFAVRHLGCTAGINVTASHNPKKYNGYKVYGADGAQLSPDRADKIAGYMDTLDIFDDVKTMDYASAVESGMIIPVGSETDEAYMENVLKQSMDGSCISGARDLRVVYTPFHGAGAEIIPEVLKRAGLKSLFCVEEQMEENGDFPTLRSPNPEDLDGFDLAKRLGEKVGAQLLLASDPDADRVGVMVRDAGGVYRALDGNQIGVLLLAYIIDAGRRTGRLPERAAVVKSIVTTEMVRKIAGENGMNCYDTFTGFKYVAGKKLEVESSGEDVVLAFEESYGYLMGGYTMDKDAACTSLLLTEMAAWYGEQGKDLLTVLGELYERYGWYREHTISMVMDGLDGMAMRKSIMESLRDEPLWEICGGKVAVWRDYKSGTVHSRVSGEVTEMELSGSDVCRYELEDGTVIVVRPSGTEPKIKVYIMACGASKGECEMAVERYRGIEQLLLSRTKTKLRT